MVWLSQPLIFVVAYILVILEGNHTAAQIKAVLMAAGLIWALIGMAYAAAGLGEQAEAAAQRVIMEYGELFLFLLVAITYVNTLEERRIFDVLRAKLTSRNLSYRKLFWLTGIFAFFLSSVLDNLTTALIMGAVALAIGTKSPKFIAVSCISIVVAANAGGAFSPFGDITTLMVWQKNKLAFVEFLHCNAITYQLAGACPLQRFAIPGETPAASAENYPRQGLGANGVSVLFALTIATAVAFRNFLHLPPAMGMSWAWAICRCGRICLRTQRHAPRGWRHVLNSFKQLSGLNGIRCCSSSGIFCGGRPLVCWVIWRWPANFSMSISAPRQQISHRCALCYRR